MASATADPRDPVSRGAAPEPPPFADAPRVVFLVALTAVYFLAGKLGLALAFVHASASAVWPPTGIALAAALPPAARSCSHRCSSSGPGPWARGAATAAVVLSGIALWGTLQGYGPFARESPNESLLFLQAFVGVATVMALVLAADTRNGSLRRINE